MRRYGIAACVLLLLTGLALARDDRGFLGVTISARENFNDAKLNGIFIEKVHEGSAAAVAGLKEKDQIFRLNEVNITSMDDLDAALAGTRPGENVHLAVVRDKKEESVRVKLGPPPVKTKPEVAGTVNRWVVGMLSPVPGLGMETQALNEQLAGFFGVEAGLLVTEVYEKGPARDAGIRAGDVIVDMDGTATRDNAHLAEVFQRHEPGDVVDLSILRDGQISGFAVQLAEPKVKTEVALSLDLAPTEDGTATIDFGTTVLSGSKIELQGSTAKVTGPVTIEVAEVREGVDELRLRIRELSRELRRLQEELERRESE